LLFYFMFKIILPSKWKMLKSCMNRRAIGVGLLSALVSSQPTSCVTNIAFCHLNRNPLLKIESLPHFNEIQTSDILPGIEATLNDLDKEFTLLDNHVFNVNDLAASLMAARWAQHWAPQWEIHLAASLMAARWAQHWAPQWEHRSCSAG
jgi:hypothetical protein